MGVRIFDSHKPVCKPEFQLHFNERVRVMATLQVIEIIVDFFMGCGHRGNSRRSHPCAVVDTRVPTRLGQSIQVSAGEFM